MTPRTTNPPTAPVSAADGLHYLQRQIDNLGERMDKSFAELKDMMRSFDERLLSFNERLHNAENREAGCQPILTARLDAAFRKLDEHERKIESHNDYLAVLRTAYRVQVFIASALGISIIALIWSLITGQARLDFAP